MVYIYIYIYIAFKSGLVSAFACRGAKKEVAGSIPRRNPSLKKGGMYSFEPTLVLLDGFSPARLQKNPASRILMYAGAPAPEKNLGGQGASEVAFWGRANTWWRDDVQ